LPLLKFQPSYITTSICFAYIITSFSWNMHYHLKSVLLPTPINMICHLISSSSFNTNYVDFSFKKGINFCLNTLQIKLYKKKSRHNFINNLSSATYFSFVSHLQTEFKPVVWTIYYNAGNGFDEISSYIIVEYCRK